MNFRKIALLLTAAALVSPVFAGTKKADKKAAPAEKKAVTAQDAPKADAPKAEKKAKKHHHKAAKKAAAAPAAPAAK